MPSRSHASHPGLGRSIPLAGLAQGLLIPGLAQLAVLDAQLHQAWPSLPVRQGLSARDQWAAAVPDPLAAAPCELFDALARAQRLPSVGAYTYVVR